MSDIQIQIAIIVIVANRNAHAVSYVTDSRLLRYIRKTKPSRRYKLIPK